MSEEEIHKVTISSDAANLLIDSFCQRMRFDEEQVTAFRSSVLGGEDLSVEQDTADALVARATEYAGVPFANLVGRYFNKPGTGQFNGRTFKQVALGVAHRR